MVVIHGRSRQTAAAFFVLAVLLASMLAYVALSIVNGLASRTPPRSEFAASLPLYVRLLIVAPFLLMFLAITLGGTLCSLYIAWRFAQGGVNLAITDDALHFPVLPGAQGGRSIAWGDLAGISVLTKENCPKELRVLLALYPLFMGHPLVLLIELVEGAQSNCTCGGVWRLFYWLDRFALAGHLRDSIVLEMTHTAGLTRGRAFEAITALADNPPLRKHYGAVGASYMIAPEPSGEVRFVLA